MAGEAIADFAIGHFCQRGGWRSCRFREKNLQSCQFLGSEYERLSAVELELSNQAGVIGVTRHELGTGQSVYERPEAAAVIERGFAIVRSLRETVATQEHIEGRTDEIAAIVGLRKPQAVDVCCDHLYDCVEDFLIAGFSDKHAKFRRQPEFVWNIWVSSGKQGAVRKTGELLGNGASATSLEHDTCNVADGFRLLPR